jgi:hypothetical protein
VKQLSTRATPAEDTVIFLLLSTQGVQPVDRLKHERKMWTAGAAAAKHL